MDFTRYDEIIQTISEKAGAFAQVGALRDWSHRIVEGIEEPSDELFTGECQTVNGGYTWSSASGNAWFWKETVLPQEVNGVSLTGSPVDVIFFLPIGCTLFLNGKQIYHEPFWSDTRSVQLRVPENCFPGEKLQFVIKAKSGDGFGLFLDCSLRIESLDKVQYELETFREQLKFCRYLLEKNPDPSKEFYLNEAVNAVDLRALKNNDWAGWRSSVQTAVDTLKPFNADAKEFEVYCIAHSHIDMNWLWPWTETVEVCRRDFSTMDSLMKRFHDFHFSQSQVSVYKAMQDYHPEIFARIKERVDQGLWEITASTWVEGDLNTAMGETLVRQILHSRRYLRENFGVEPRICWEPDTFGHPATLPQILKKCGIDYYYHCRAGKGLPVFWWEAPDGSRVQVFNDFYGYGGDIHPWAVTECIKPTYEHLGLKTGLWVYGAGDHGGSATARDIERAIALNDTPLMPRTKMTGVTDFHEKIAASGVDYPVVKDELNTIFEGCYTSHGDIKWLNRYGETSLLTAETMAALSALETGSSYPTEPLADAWKNQCFHQFHDIVCGCSISSTYKEAAETLKPSHEMLANVISDSASKLAAKVDTGAGGVKVVVFNQLAWERTDLVEVPIESFGARLGDISTSSITDEAGNELPVQVLDGKLIFVAKGVPALGCKVYSLSDGDTSAPTTLRTDAANNSMENEYLRLHVNPNSGAIDSLVIKGINREIAQPASGWGPEAKVNAGMLNRFTLYFEQPHPMSAWNIGDITRTESLISGAQVKTVETGPVCGAIEIKHSFLNSSLTQQIRIYAGLDRVDFVTEIDWHEKGGATHDAPMLKATFTPYFGDTRATYEIPFGTIERPAHGREVPALRWADISEDACGMTLLNNCKYGHSAQGNTLALTLVRASYEPDNNPDEGLHRFTYSIVPHVGGWKDVQAIKRGSEFNQPIVAAVDGSHAGEIKPGQATLTCEPSNVIVSAVKLAEDQPNGETAMIIRLFESTGDAVNAVLMTKWNISKAEETNMLEEQGTAVKTDGNSVSLNFGPYEIKTVKVYVKK